MNELQWNTGPAPKDGTIIYREWDDYIGLIEWRGANENNGAWWDTENAEFLSDGAIEGDLVENPDRWLYLSQTPPLSLNPGMITPLEIKPQGIVRCKDCAAWDVIHKKVDSKNLEACPCVRKSPTSASNIIWQYADEGCCKGIPIKLEAVQPT